LLFNRKTVFISVSLTKSRRIIVLFPAAPACAARAVAAAQAAAASARADDMNDRKCDSGEDQQRQNRVPNVHG